MSRVLFEGKREPVNSRCGIYFDPEFDGVSLPYNLYAVLVIADGETLAWMDLTQGCRDRVKLFFPVE